MVSNAVACVLLRVRHWKWRFELMSKKRPQREKDVEEAVSGPHWFQSKDKVVDL